MSRRRSGHVYFCGGCKRRYTQETWLKLHCKARGKTSTCYRWFESCYEPASGHAESSSKVNFLSTVQTRLRSLLKRRHHDRHGSTTEGPTNRLDVTRPTGAQIHDTSIDGELGAPSYHENPFDDSAAGHEQPEECNDQGEQPRETWFDEDRHDYDSSESDEPESEASFEHGMSNIREMFLGMELNRRTGTARSEEETYGLIATSKYFPGAGKIYGKGETFMDRFAKDPLSAERERTGNAYFPFSSFEEWEFVNILMRFPCSLAVKTDLVKTSFLRDAGISFSSAPQINQQIDQLPSSPRWYSQTVKLSGYSTLEPIVIYYRDAAECVEYLFNNPLFADQMGYAPVQHFTVDGKRVVRESLSGVQAWQVQEKLPEGATRLGVCLASDSTLLVTGTGDLSAHPLFISLDNISPSARRDHSNHSTLLLALMPEVEITNEQDNSVARAIRDRIFHHNLRLVTAPLRKIARSGKFMSDPLGQLRLCYTVLSLYSVDLPEATMLAGVIGKTSPVTVATYKNLGDPVRHDVRWLADTKRILNEISKIAHPVKEIKKFIALAMKEKLTGVTEFVWDEWDHCEPALALAFDLLHSGHKFYGDHPQEWSAEAATKEELDKRYKSLHPRSGYRHFRKGVTGLQKTGGRDHRDMQRYILAALDGTVPRKFLAVIRSHLEYFYIAQSPEISEDDLTDITDLLSEFHEKISIVVENGYRKRGGGKLYIPKLELQHHIVPSIATHGAIITASTDISERTHVDAVKNMYRKTNKKNHQPQMLKALSREEQLRHFDLATALANANGTEERMDPAQFHIDVDMDGKNLFLNNLQTVQNLRSGKRAGHINHFQVLKYIEALDEADSRRHTIRTLAVTPFTAIHLSRDPHLGVMSVQEASRIFRLSDLSESLRSFYHQYHTQDCRPDGPVLSRSSVPTSAPFPEIKELRIWSNVKVQTKSLLDPGKVNRAATIFAEPPLLDRQRTAESAAQALDWKSGRYDCALFINDLEKRFTGRANLQGEILCPYARAQAYCFLLDHCVGQVRLIFQPVVLGERNQPYLVYAQRFDCAHASRGADPDSGLFRLSRARQGRIRIGAVVEVGRIRAAVAVEPYFGKQIDADITCCNGLEISRFFNLNKYCDKETFQLLRERHG